MIINTINNEIAILFKFCVILNIDLLSLLINEDKIPPSTTTTIKIHVTKKIMFL